MRKLVAVAIIIILRVLGKKEPDGAVWLGNKPWIFPAMMAIKGTRDGAGVVHLLGYTVPDNWGVKWSNVEGYWDMPSWRGTVQDRP